MTQKKPMPPIIVVSWCIFAWCAIAFLIWFSEKSPFAMINSIIGAALCFPPLYKLYRRYAPRLPRVLFIALAVIVLIFGSLITVRLDNVIWPWLKHSNDQTVILEATPTPTVTSTPTIAPTPTPAPAPTIDPTNTPDPTVKPTPDEDEQEEMVWIPTNGGTKYHSKKSCRQMKDPECVPISEAIRRGFDPCKICH